MALTKVTYSMIQGQFINALDYGVDNTGATDTSTALQAAITAAAGIPVYLPAGTYVIGTAIKYETTAQWAPALKLFGDGAGKTIIDNRVANGSCITTQSTVSLKFQLEGYIRDLEIKTTTSPASSNGIDLKAVYQFEVLNVYIHGMTGNGAQITCLLGDADAANNVTFRNCRIENCNIGLNSNYAAGVVQPSFIKVDKCFFSGHTTAGWKYAGLNSYCTNSAFAAMGCAGVWFWFNGANNGQFTMTATSFENCGSSTQPSVRIDSLTSGAFSNVEIANTVQITTKPIYGVLMTSTGSGQSQANVTWDNTYVRIGSSFTPMTMFSFGASSYECRVTNTLWQSYDASGQERYYDAGSSNTLSNAFSQVVQGTVAGTVLTAATGANQNFALPLDGTAWVVTGPSGSFSFGGFTNGIPGRELILVNLSGQTMKLTYEDTSSTAANRIRANAAADVTINNAGAARLMYINSRWQVISKG